MLHALSHSHPEPLEAHALGIIIDGQSSHVLVDCGNEFFTNTELTPTETAHIVAKANLHAHKMGALNTANKPNSNAGSGSATRRSQTSISPLRQVTQSQSQSQRESSCLQFRKTTPKRKQQKNTSSTRTVGGSMHGHTPF